MSKYKLNKQKRWSNKNTDITSPKKSYFFETEEPALFGNYDELKEKPWWGRDSPPQSFPTAQASLHPTPISGSRAGGAGHTISRDVLLKQWSVSKR